VDPRSALPPEPPTDASSEAAEPIAEAAAPARQRWRLVLARDAAAPGLTGRDLVEAWDVTLDASGLPLVRPVGRVRARIALGAPVPASMALEREVADILLTEMVAAWDVREALAGRLPDGWRLIDLHDVWLGAPALAGQVAAADYRIDLDEVDADVVTRAAQSLMEADRLPRERLKGGTAVSYDLRPLVVDVVVADQGPPLVIQARTLFHPALGTGRPEEIVGALGELAGRPFDVRSIVRERLILVDELDLDR
jgi:hypothetical protein